MFNRKQLNRIEVKLDALLTKVTTMSTQISANLQALMTQVAQNTSVEASAVTLIQGIASELSAALANSDDAALPALVTQLQNSAAALGAAVAANTPTNVVTSSSPTASAASAAKAP
jgi:uncharacterized membrane protein affecting hemolysin expression